MLVFEQIRTGGDRNFGYLLGDRDAGQAVLVDPSFAPTTLVDRARAQGLTVTHVLNTHGHPDHTNGNDTALRLTGAQLVAHPDSATRLDHPVADGEEIRIGSLTIRAFYTPGHSEDSVCYLVDEICLTGDTLFVGKVGGTVTRNAAETEYRSLHRVLLTLPDPTTVWPGHDYGCRPSSTIGLEKRTNPFLLCPDLSAFLRLKAEWATYKATHGLL